MGNVTKGILRYTTQETIGQQLPQTSNDSATHCPVHAPHVPHACYRQHAKLLVHTLD